MRAVRVHASGGVDAMVYEDVPKPAPGPGQVLIRVAAAGVGSWDAWIREGKSVLPQPLPLTLGADLSGTIEEVGRTLPFSSQAIRFSVSPMWGLPALMRNTPSLRLP
jgi:NADPH:quinone reductase-like Zn-dependent oxidoreductase